MLQAREIQRDEPKVADVFNVPPKEYSVATGMTPRGAQKFFKRAFKKGDKHFKKIGERILASRSWFKAL